MTLILCGARGHGAAETPLLPCTKLPWAFLLLCSQPGSQEMCCEAMHSSTVIALLVWCDGASLRGLLLMGSGDQAPPDKTSSDQKIALLHFKYKASSVMSRQKCVDGSFGQSHQEGQGNLKSNLRC